MILAVSGALAMLAVGLFPELPAEVFHDIRIPL
jgi:hypothetical protein